MGPIAPAWDPGGEGRAGIFYDPPPSASPMSLGLFIAAGGAVGVLGCVEVIGVQVEATGGFLLRRCSVKYSSTLTASRGEESLPRNLTGSDGSIHTSGVEVCNMDPELFSAPRTHQRWETFAKVAMETGTQSDTNKC